MYSVMKASIIIKQIFHVLLIRHKLREEEFINNFPMENMSEEQGKYPSCLDRHAFHLSNQNKKEKEIELFLNEKN